MSAGTQNNGSIPAVVTSDTNFDKFIFNLSMRATGAPAGAIGRGTIELGITFDKGEKQNQVLFRHTGLDAVPANLVADLQSKLPELLLGILGSAFAGQRVPANVRTHTAQKPIAFTVVATPASAATPSLVAACKVVFTSGSTDTPLTYAWTTSDGQTSTSATPTFTFTKRGSFTITCTVTGTSTNSQKASVTVKVGTDAHVG